MRKIDYYRAILKILNTINVEKKEELIDFTQKQINHIQARTEKAAAAGDELKEIIKSVLTDEYQSAGDILLALEEKIEGVSKAKVIAKLAQLIITEEIEKVQVVTEDGKKIMNYRLKGE